MPSPQNENVVQTEGSPMQVQS